MAPAPSPPHFGPDDAAAWRLLADQQVAVAVRVDAIEDRTVRMDERLGHMQQDVEGLLYLVRDGNGRPSLMTVAERLHRELEHLRGDVTSMQALQAERRTDRSKITLTLVASATALFTALITAGAQIIIALSTTPPGP